MGKIVYVSFYLFLLFFVFFVIDTEWKLEKTYKTSWGIPVYKYTFLSTKSYTLRALNSVFWGVRRGCVGCTYHNASKFFFNRYLYNKNYMHTYCNIMKLFSKMLRFGDFDKGYWNKSIQLIPLPFQSFLVAMSVCDKWNTFIHGTSIWS